MSQPARRPRPIDAALRARAATHDALGDPHRLAIVEALELNDRSPSDLAALLGIGSNLLAHHLRQLKAAGLVDEAVSSGDRRRRYLRLRGDALAAPWHAMTVRADDVLFVCTHNSGRSQLAAALFQRATGLPARSAGTHPARRVHPLAVETAERHGLDLGGATPRMLAASDLGRGLLVTVCDQAHEELAATPAARLHWSVPDPAAVGTRAAFERAYGLLDRRVAALARHSPWTR
ncbi:MAG: helix-turn-helix domain-containing protein [SAR202 cluster bacterium]|nr:helix-turn-helix domain-containing protein [SAR202 cluster bacterium]